MKTADKLEALGTRPVGRLLWEYSIPAVTGMLVMALYNVVDRIFIGQWLGANAISGLAVTFPLMNLATAIGVLVGVGAAARVSIDLGAGDKPKAETVLGNAFTLTFLNAAVYIAVFVIFIDSFLRAFGASDATLPYARDYMLTLTPGLLLTNVAFGFNNIMRSSGYPGRAMMTMLIGAGVNVVLDPIFIKVFGWGIEGAAWATDIAMGVSALFVVWHFMRRDVTLRFRRGTFRLRWRLVWGIVTIGAAPALINAAACLINALINNTLLRYGSDLDIGAAGIMITVTSLLVTTVLGICQGLQPIIGYNYGANKPHRLRKAYFLAMGVASAITLAGTVAILVFPREIAMAFTNDEQLLDATERALTKCILCFPVVGFQIVSSCLFQSLGKAGKSIILSLLRQVIFLIPLLMFLPRVMELDGVWYSFPISDALATIVTIFLVVWQLRHIHYKVAALKE
ncbi:MAG: MATE family efflux transporter [Muribaculaceae bacterium]|nr:MATE family efflux transporter [Muribaculaceae bacterium]